MTDQKNRPVDTLRDGNLKAAIWENEREDYTAHSVQFRRSYRDKEGQLRDTDSFAKGELLRLARLAEQSYDRIGKLREAARENNPPERSRARDRADRDQGGRDRLSRRRRPSRSRQPGLRRGRGRGCLTPPKSRTSAT